MNADFLEYARTEYSAENIEFLNAEWSFRSTFARTRGRALRAAFDSICLTYILDKSPKEVNIGAPAKRETVKACNDKKRAPQRNDFQLAKQDTKKNAIDTLTRYRFTDDFRRLIADYAERMADFYAELFDRNAENAKVQECLRGKVGAPAKDAKSRAKAGAGA
ncbi:hypothetical protein DFJ74DRAFT_453875 [Hyaloraphidium curvatum]|nr:hypothetical protein DFJ74DRAFT_453875 [Hyaloraphidium curvatum]